LAVEAEIPSATRESMAKDKQRFTTVRYEVEVGMDVARNEVGLQHETLWLKESSRSALPVQREFFPGVRDDSPKILSTSKRGQRAALTKKRGGNDNYYTEGRKSYMPSFKLGPGKSALANLPARPGNRVAVLDLDLRQPGAGGNPQSGGVEPAGARARPLLRKGCQRLQEWFPPGGGLPPSAGE
jgi:hypothetical protein